ncbi:MAG: nucleotide sugar dehydrogenase [Candidatus Cloacimonadota bacterium]|nr:nucleotide sugar dehydrogenase [Candidatus Cloacimonadota bacterium]
MQIIKKIENKSAIVGIIGLGYVGLPMAVTVARNGYKTIGVDVNDYAVTHVNNGENYIGDVDDAELKELVEKKLLSASLDYSAIKDCDIIMVAVPTPLDKYQQPDSSFVQSSVDSLAKNVSKDTLVILESTTYPGTTEEIVAPAFEKAGFTVGEDIFVSFSPERVDPGNKTYKTANTPKVVGGMTKKCNEISKVFYNAILEAPIHLVSSPNIAEMEKIYENTFRNINIALANEMTILCDKMGIDMWEVIEAAKTKPYGFMAFYPGPGIGGHCIPLDPFYLTWKAREYKYHTRLIELSGEINNEMPTFVISKSIKLLNKKGIALSKAKVLILGAAYKRNISDMRESPIEQLIVELEEYDVNFDYNDPHVPKFHNERNGKNYKSVSLDNLENYDLVIIVTDHAAYDYEELVNRSNLILDTRRACGNRKSDNLFRL